MSQTLQPSNIHRLSRMLSFGEKWRALLCHWLLPATFFCLGFLEDLGLRLEAPYQENMLLLEEITFYG
ncbi:MAG: hypothetical protein OXG78_16460 [Chloroflexi bacterium]|nr:hypothetical protein [Chloroflexota bacterium]